MLSVTYCIYPWYSSYLFRYRQSDQPLWRRSTPNTTATGVIIDSMGRSNGWLWQYWGDRTVSNHHNYRLPH